MEGIHALHESPPFATPDAKSCFCFPCLWQSKRKSRTFLQRTALVEVLIPDDDPVHLLSAFVEELERVKRLYVSKTMKEKRRKDLERITSGYGTQLKMNRNIQAEDLDKYAQKVRRQLRSLDRYCDGTFYLVLFISDTLLCDVRLQ